MVLRYATEQLVDHSFDAEVQKSSTHRVIVACFPKSGSTYLTKILSSLPGMTRSRLVPGYDHREQELDESLVVDVIQRIEATRSEHLDAGIPSEDPQVPKGFVDQLHLKCSSTTLRIANEQQLAIVVLVRDIFDVIVSMRDHLRIFGPYQSMAFVTPAIALNDDEYVVNFIADLIVPWYINFYVGWSYVSVPMVTYEQLTSDPVAVVEKCVNCSAVSSAFTKADIESAVDQSSKGFTRLNHGTAGRGRTLPVSVVERVHSLVSYYPEVDWSPVGVVV